MQMNSNENLVAIGATPDLPESINRGSFNGSIVSMTEAIVQQKEVKFK
jgi:hypothetical protein